MPAMILITVPVPAAAYSWVERNTIKIAIPAITRIQNHFLPEISSSLESQAIQNPTGNASIISRSARILIINSRIVSSI